MIDFLLLIVALLIVITIHEFSHAYVANFFGDPTAKLAGRMSLNPLVHLDPMGTLMLFLIHIGWGKPVPVNPRYFKNPKKEEALTALAGPFSNLLLALVLAVPLKYAVTLLPHPIFNFLKLVFDISIFLFIFNMLPFPPLDGSKIVAFFVPKRYEYIYANYLQRGALYFGLFLLFDYFVLASILQQSFLSLFIGKIYTLLQTVIFLGT